MRTFETTVRYFDARLSYIPLELVLGFFCTAVINRWTKWYQTIGFIDNVGLMTALYLRGTCERARLYRRNIIRYCELVQVLVFRDISMRTRRRFPTLDTVVAAGFLLPQEKELLDEYDDHGKTPKYWVPANWALSMTYKAWKQGHIESDYFKAALEKEIRTFREQIEWVFNYDWVPMPLMYPQVVCLAVHLHFMVALIAKQYIVEEHQETDKIDAYFPFMTFLQFVFYMGWMKVIEVCINPFGEDDDDFETNALIDRNITMGMMIVDRGYNRPPEMQKDPFWEDDNVHPLYSEETSKTRNYPPQGSVSHIKLPSNTQEVVMMPHSSSMNKSLGGKVDVETPEVRSSCRRNTVRVKEDEREPNRPRRQNSYLESFRSILDK
ncbi:unnamed protein product [Auanema sp. JU1783]|nr:unnamed protein product [Auanema sp. JU1783]